MAEVDSSANRSFFCHKCNVQITPVLPDYICPRCRSGFIEQISQPQSPAVSTPDEASAVAFNPNDFNYFLDTFRILTAPDAHNGAHALGSDQMDASGSRPGGTVLQVGSGPGGARVTFRQRSLDSGSGSNVAGMQPLEGIINQILANITGAGAQQGGTVGNANFPPIFLNLHGNPGDYVWGRGGLDAIITQLLNQLDGAGPPPLPRDKIDEIPTVKISEEQVTKNLQCTVCMEDFKLAEPVRLLPCAHHFHNDCIVPWLELHGTCPICRKALNGDQQQSPDENNSGGGAAGNRPANDRGSSNNSYHTADGSVYDFMDEFD